MNIEFDYRIIFISICKTNAHKKKFLQLYYLLKISYRKRGSYCLLVKNEDLC